MVYKICLRSSMSWLNYSISLVPSSFMLIWYNPMVPIVVMRTCVIIIRCELCEGS